MKHLEHCTEETTILSDQSINNPPLAPSDEEKANLEKLPPQISDSITESTLDNFVYCRHTILIACILMSNRTMILLAGELRPLTFHIKKLQ